MRIRYQVSIYKEEICDECGHQTIKELIFMRVIPEETVEEIKTLLKEKLADEAKKNPTVESSVHVSNQ